MKKITIIGANSYIARNIIFVLKNKYNCVLNLYDCTEKHIDGELNYSQINILDKASVSNIELDCDIVYMFVGKTGSANGFDEYDAFIDINEKALLNILNEMRNQNSSAKIIFPSTRLVYKGKECPQSEDSEKEFKTIYAINKFACENILKQFNTVFGIDYSIFRICVPYGTLIKDASSYGTAEFMINKARNNQNISLYGDGSQRRTLIYMEDLCVALIEGALSEECINDVYNIGGEDYSLREMADLIAGIYGVGVECIEWPEVALKIESGSTVFDSHKFDSLGLMTYETNFAEWCMNQ